MIGDTLTVVIVAVGAPAILAVVTATLARGAKRQDWARQDAVAARAETAAALLFARTVAAARAASEAQASTDLQLKRIHTLVNSDMTAARRDELDQTRAALAALHRVVALLNAAGQSVTAEDLAAIESKEARIEELTAILADRLHQQAIVEADLAAAKHKEEHP